MFAPFELLLCICLLSPEFVSIFFQWFCWLMVSESHWYHLFLIFSCVPGVTGVQHSIRLIFSKCFLACCGRRSLISVYLLQVFPKLVLFGSHCQRSFFKVFSWPLVLRLFVVPSLVCLHVFPFIFSFVCGVRPFCVPFFCFFMYFLACPPCVFHCCLCSWNQFFFCFPPCVSMIPLARAV